MSDILRRYVTEQYSVPVTRADFRRVSHRMLAKSSPFSAEETSLLGDFLNRCDLIKFARYAATITTACQLGSDALCERRAACDCLIVYVIPAEEEESRGST